MCMQACISATEGSGGNGVRGSKVPTVRPLGGDRYPVPWSSTAKWLNGLGGDDRTHRPIKDEVWQFLVGGAS